MKVIHEFDLTEYNAYRIKAVCARAFFPENENEIIDVYKSNPETKKVILGNGNNVILSKESYKDDFIILNGNFDDIKFFDAIIEVDAGATLEQLSLNALHQKLSGLEVFYDIPSSVGGAVVMNAGTKEGEVKDVLVKVRYLDLEDMQIKEIAKEDINFEYRNSFFQKNPDKIVLKAWFKLSPGEKKNIQAKMEETKRIRWEKQPRNLPNCGSVFKRPAGRFVGPMLDELGLKGFSIGGAMISPKHSGFIVNTGSATGRDILNLIEFVKEKVKVSFGVSLEIEQRII